MSYTATTKQKKSRRYMILGLVLALLAAGAVSAYFITKSTDNTGTEPENAQNQSRGIEEKGNLIAEGANPEQSTPSKPGNVPDSTTYNPGQPAATIQAEQDNQNRIIVRTQLENVSRGTCSLQATQAGTQKTFDAEIIYQEDYSTCAGFAIPASDLGSGKWSFILTVKSPEGTQKSNTVTIEVKA